ncbi:Glutathione S-transferase [Aspergillus sp. HF37]|nr:Glutathione S-transferase [Aspergillus sp. HF37]
MDLLFVLEEPRLHGPEVIRPRLEEVIVDITKPREPWYLEINPVGLQQQQLSDSILKLLTVNRKASSPALSYNGTNIIEFATIAQLIADAHPSHLLPPCSPADNAVVPNVFAGVMAPSEEERDAFAEKMVDGIATEVEPLLLSGKGPFYGGSEQLILAEVQCGPFIIRMLALSNSEHGLFSTKLPELLEKVPKFKRWARPWSVMIV